MLFLFILYPLTEWFSQKICRYFLYEFKLGHNATVYYINWAFGEGSASQRTIRLWFEKFHSSIMNLDNEFRVRFKSNVNEAHLRGIVEAIHIQKFEFLNGIKVLVL